MDKGVEKGELIGNIRTTQGFLRRRVASREKFAQKTTDELKAILEKLESELSF